MTTTTKTKAKTTETKTKTTSVKVETSLDLPKNPFAFEVFDLASRQRTKEKKVEAKK